MEFRILGPFEVQGGGRAVQLGGLRQRSVLAVLLLNAGELVPTERLVDELWGEDTPKAAVKTVQVYIGRLRKLLGPDAIVTRPPGYLLRADPEQIDARRFERLAAEGHEALAAGDVAAAAGLLREALSLWRGAPLSDFAYEPFAQAEAARLEELRLRALEDRIESDLRSGKAAELIAELQALTARHPLRERLRGQLMIALYRAGRQSEALDAYRDLRLTLVEELGIEPSRALRELEGAVLGQDPRLLRPRGRSAGAFVGRDAELQTLHKAVGDAHQGRGRVVLVSGEPGIGKSHLADEVATLARDEGLHVLRGRCWEAGGAPAFWPWVQVLRSCVRNVEPERLRRYVGAGGPELVELLPELREVLGDVPEPAARDPEALRFRVFDAVAATLCTIADRDRPVVIILDDLHAADEPSLLLTSFLARAIDGSRVMLLGAFRDTELRKDDALARVVGELTREARLSRIALEGLRRDDIDDYVRMVAGPATPDLIDALHGRTAGNALFIVETVRLLAAKGELANVDVEAAVPTGLRDAVERRLGPLPEPTRAALSAAAVLGHEFHPAQLEDVLGTGAINAVDAAIAGRLLVAAAGTPGALRFSHALVRDALYAAIRAPSRRELHRRAAHAIESRYAADLTPHLAALAHHFHLADDPQAVAYAKQAAQVAADRLAYEEAARLYRLAVELIEHFGGADAAEFCDLLLALGDVEARAGDDASAKPTFLRAADIARRSEMAEQLGRAAVGYGGRFVWTKGRGDPHLLALVEEAVSLLPARDSALRARLLARLAAGPLVLQGEASRARRFDLTDEAVEIARRLGDPAVLAWALDGRKVAIWAPDTLEEQWSIMDELRELAERSGDPEQIVDARICRLIKLVERAELAQFEDEYAAARRIADELGQPGQRWLVATHEPMYALLTGRLASAEQLIERAYELGRDAVPWNARMARVRQEVVLCGLRGRPDDAEAELRSTAADEALYPSMQAALAGLYADMGDVARCRAAFEPLTARAFMAIPFDDVWILTVGLLAHACSFLGDRDRAAILYERLEPFAHRQQVAAVEASLGSAARPLGELAATLGETELATRWFERAAEIDERSGALPWAAYAWLAHGEMLLGVGQASAAAPLLDRAAATYRALGMEAWEQRSTLALASA
jgi:DNA-binding SARP family transcriptional activator